MGTFDFVKKLDTFTREKRDDMTFYGGILQILVWLLAFVYLIIYVQQTLVSEFPINTDSNPFPMDEADLKGAKAFATPTFTCDAQEGCYVYTKATDKCIYYAKDEMVTGFDLYYDPFPVMSVLVPGTSSMSSLSYRITKVTKYQDPMETATDATSSHMVPVGMSQLNVARTIGVEKTFDTREILETWTTSLTTLSSRVLDNKCCTATDVYKLDSDGVPVKDSGAEAAMALCGIASVASDPAHANIAGWWTTDLNAPTYYTLIRVIDPTSFGVIFGLIGGWVASLTIVAAVVFGVTNYLSKGAKPKTHSPSMMDQKAHAASALVSAEKHEENSL